MNTVKNYAQVSDQWRVIVITVMNHAQNSDQWRVIVSTVVNHSQDSDRWGFCDPCDESRSG